MMNTEAQTAATPPGRCSFGLAHVLLWMAAAACVLGFVRTHPHSFPGESAAGLTYIALFAAIGGILLASLAWYSPGALRGELARWEPGEVLLFGLGWMVAGDAVAITVSHECYSIGTNYFDELVQGAKRDSLYVILTATWGCLVWSGLFLGQPQSRWKVVFAAIGLAYLPFLEQAVGRLERLEDYDSVMHCFPTSLVELASALLPWLLALAFLWAVCVDLHRRYGAAHWLGVVLLAVTVLKQLHFVGWLQQAIGVHF